MMKTVRMSIILASMIGAATLLLAPVAMSVTPGNGWDIFYTGDGEPISVSSYQGTSMGSASGQGFDLFNTGDGVKIESSASAYMGTSLGSKASSGWDIYHAGDGDPLP